MDRWSGLHYNAVGVEHNFAIFFGACIGDRGEICDADVFRRGNRPTIGKLLIATAEHFKRRAAALKFEPEDSEGGGMSARLNSAIRALREIEEGLVEEGGDERDDYHWIIVGELILVIASLFGYIERRA